MIYMLHRNSWLKLVKSIRVCRVNIWSTLKGSGSPQKTLNLSENQVFKNIVLCTMPKSQKILVFYFQKSRDLYPEIPGSRRGIVPRRPHWLCAWTMNAKVSQRWFARNEIWLKIVCQEFRHIRNMISVSRLCTLQSTEYSCLDLWTQNS